ncbi:MAG: hypothetical protein QG601_1610 [Pseudomonadota bacterium]|nr:hypothetical protein [Pseudomonadota bacterium]
MRMHSSQLVARLVVLLALGASVAQAQDAPAQAPAPTADARVERLLKEVAAEYTVDEDGDFRLVYDIGGGRSQLVWIPSGTSDFGALEIRQIWSIAHRAKGPLPADLANRLLDRNGAVILGAWLTEPAGDELGVIFAVQVAAEADALSLRSAIHAVATTADAMESELTGKDDF